MYTGRREGLSKLSFLPSKTFTLGGQQVTYNPNTKSLRFAIHDPFKFAGKILDWKSEFGWKGLGINRAILEFIKPQNLKLIIHVDSSTQDYMIQSAVIEKFIQNYDTKYEAGGTLVDVIPIKLFLGNNLKTEITS